MAKVACIFRGQGNLQVGMGKGAWEHSKRARLVIATADRILGWPLSELCFEGPEAELQKTANAQPAAVVMALADLAVSCKVKRLEGDDLRFVIKNRKIAFLTGHSVGYYAALVAAGVLTLRQCLLLVTIRAQAMTLACQINPGKMLALIDPDRERVAELCSRFGVSMANDNSSTQVVISGAIKPMEAFEKAIREGRIARVLPLRTEGAFHDKSMKPAESFLAAIVSQINFADLRVPIIANSSARPITTVHEAKEEAVRQLCSPVLWAQSMDFLNVNNVDTTIEMGGEVLSKMLERESRMTRLRNFISVHARLLVKRRLKTTSS